ncbi:UNVERIFIED_CONTAM: hypothetical protein Sangu_0701600 [Sesamum angustifolium]|uniref:Uncharacterized protein n=1 Tax=Sesamum angustifolium TaxID=2727405 RepID=A0AAW2PRS2_9LAMI
MEKAKSSISSSGFLPQRHVCSLSQEEQIIVRIKLAPQSNVKGNFKCGSCEQDIQNVPVTLSRADQEKPEKPTPTWRLLKGNI